MFVCSGSNHDRSLTNSQDYDGGPEDSHPVMFPKRKGSGILKTVGDPTLADESNAGQRTTVFDIPDVDFGTTFTPTLTPSYSRPATAIGFSGRESPFDRPHTTPTSPSTRFPQEERNSPIVISPAEEQRSPHTWYPGMSSTRHKSMGGLTAEDFVAQRAAAARLPQGYVPHRSASSGKIEQSPDKLQRKRQSILRSSSRHSLLMDYPPQLSAREQEHVAKVTGGTLIQINERSKTPDPSIGLIGAIEAREQEKRNIKEGLAGHMVHEAIAQRQAAERNYGMQQYAGYIPLTKNRQSGNWTIPRLSIYLAATLPQQQQQAWSTPAWQYQQQAQAQLMHPARSQQQSQMHKF